MYLKKIGFFVVIIISLMIINNLTRSIISLWQKRGLVENTREQISEEKKQNEELKEKIEEVKKPEFVEEEARNKLFMAKPGEGIVVLPSTALRASDSAEKEPEDKRQNWEKWWELFF